MNNYLSNFNDREFVVPHDFDLEKPRFCLVLNVLSPMLPKPADRVMVGGIPR